MFTPLLPLLHRIETASLARQLPQERACLEEMNFESTEKQD